MCAAHSGHAKHGAAKESERGGLGNCARGRLIVPFSALRLH
jgi:hypothetical protein